VTSPKRLSRTKLRQGAAVFLELLNAVVQRRDAVSGKRSP
jgi:hypothetical protein